MPTPNKPIAAPATIRRRFLKTSALALLPVAWLSACGGGDDEPTITLYATITGGVEGAVFTLSAEADDDDGISKVEFFQVNSNSEVLLATFSASPFLLQTQIPTGTAGTTIEYMARVTDTDDQTADSNRVAIGVSS
jgi:Bacterial Ig domain